MRDFFVCCENELTELMKKDKRKSPRIYLAGYTKYSRWVYEDYSHDSDLLEERFYFVDYSDDGEDAVWDKFFEFNIDKIIKNKSYEQVTVNRNDYSIDVCCNEFEYFSLYAFWHTAALSEDELKWLNDRDD